MSIAGVSDQTRQAIVDALARIVSAPSVKGCLDSVIRSPIERFFIDDLLVGVAFHGWSVMGPARSDHTWEWQRAIRDLAWDGKKVKGCPFACISVVPTPLPQEDVDIIGARAKEGDIEYGTLESWYRWCLYGWMLVAQYPVDRYAIDFAFLSMDGRRRIAVECDGHDYHERTKEQAKHDRKRDRILQRKGWEVMRFTGSEIHAQAGHRGPAGEVLHRLLEMSDLEIESRFPGAGSRR